MSLNRYMSVTVIGLAIILEKDCNSIENPFPRTYVSLCEVGSNKKLDTTNQSRVHTFLVRAVLWVC